MPIDPNLPTRAQQGASAKLKPATQAGATAVDCRSAPEDELLVTKVEGPDEVTFQDTAVYRVTEYSRSPVSESDKRRVMWRVVWIRIDSSGFESSTEEYKTSSVGDTLHLDIPRDCEHPVTRIRVYPYIKQPVRRVSWETAVYCLPNPVPIEAIKQAFEPGKKDSIYQYQGCVYIVAFRNPTEMIPFRRIGDELFSDTVERKANNMGFCTVINGDFYDVTLYGGFMALALGWAESAPASSTTILGKFTEYGGMQGESAPKMFNFQENSGIYTSGVGDPPSGNAFGGAGPLIIGGLPYGPTNDYNACFMEDPPLTDEPGKPYRDYLIRRSNKTYESLSERTTREPTTGKTILAFRSSDRLLALIVQKHGVCALTLDEIRDLLVTEKFNHAVFVDGSDSAMLYARRSFLVSQGYLKNATNTMGIGFKCR